MPWSGAGPVGGGEGGAVLSERQYCYVSGIRLGIPALEELCDRGMPPGLVVSYPVELAHRSGYTDYEPVVRKYDLPLLRCGDINSTEVVEALAEHRIDLMVVAGWSQVVDEQVLASLPLGGVGLHPAPLPVGRGYAPIPWTILHDMRASAVSLFHMAHKPHLGDIIDQVWFDIEPEATATGLYRQVAGLQAHLLAEHLPGVLAGTAPRRRQAGQASAWPRRRPCDGHIDWSDSGQEVFRLVRALADPYPGAFAMLDGIRVTFAGGTVLGGATGPWRPGLIVQGRGPHEWGVVCGDATVFAPRAVRIDEGPETEPWSVAMLRPGLWFDER